MSLKDMRTLSKNPRVVTLLCTLFLGSMAIILWQLVGTSAVLIFLSVLTLITFASQFYLVATLAKEIVQLHEKITNLERRIS